MNLFREREREVVVCMVQFVLPEKIFFPIVEYFRVKTFFEKINVLGFCCILKNASKKLTFYYFLEIFSYQTEI